MRFRGKSIRRKIVALLLVPLVSLAAIWGFATVLTGREVTRVFDVSRVVENIGYPVEDTIHALQQERRQTLVYLADPRASDALSALHRTRAATDAAIVKIRKNSADSDVRDGMNSGDGERLTTVLDAVDGVNPLRRSVEDGTVTRQQALDLYDRVVDPCYSLLASLEGVDDVEMDTQARALVNADRARELFSREDALLGSALVVGRLTPDETREISDLAAQRTLLYDISLPLLPASERDRYDRFWKDAATAPVRVAEEAVIGSGPGTVNEVSAKSWDAAAGTVLEELRTLDDQADDRYQDRTHPVAVSVIVQAAVAGLLGLVALIVSLVLSVRIGRGLIRDLRQLRLEAHEASGVRLPSVMRRLSAGEKVDVETEAPRLEYDRNEIGEVGQALNTLQHAAVEAAVKQAELRAGVSEVFVNLARRSQVLLHKQLTLLDSMERRTEDTDELADLFRLDHLTTRMRRHAEGLVILSGAAPSRQWRKPVQLMDVVRAAVAEVEDYERIEVRRLPRVAVTGPAVADLTHLMAELLENATVFSPPHTAVQAIGERVANGFTLEIHDRGLGMAAEALLEANLRLAETPEFELSDTDRLGLFVVSRLAQRQNVRVSLQPSPYGGTTAVVFIPDALLSDDVPDTNGVGFRLDRTTKETDREERRPAALAQVPVQLPSPPTPLLDGPVELEAAVDLDALDGFPDALADKHDERGGLFRIRRSLARADDEAADRTAADHRQPSDAKDRTGAFDDRPDAPVPLPRRTTPTLVSSHGRPIREQRSPRDTENETPAAGGPGADPNPAPLPMRRREEKSPRPGGGRDGRSATRAESSADGPGESPETPRLPRRPRRPEIGSGDDGPNDTTQPTDGTPQQSGSGTGPLPRRVRQASLAPQLKQDPAQGADSRTEPAERDADQVRSRMASLQRGWQRGREENAAGDDARNGTAAQGTTKGDSR